MSDPAPNPTPSPSRPTRASGADRQTSPAPFWAVALERAGLYVADSEADAIAIHQLLEYEWGQAFVVCAPVKGAVDAG